MKKGLVCGILLTATLVAQEPERFRRLEQQLDQIREQLKIPGMSVAVLKDQQVVWSKGFGYADLAGRVPRTAGTPQPVASLTKTLAATLVMQLVEQGKLDLDEPVSKYSKDFSGDTVKIKHLLSHTSEGTPGENYSYNGNRYGYLTTILEQKTGKSFRRLLRETFLDPLEMRDTVPGHDLETDGDKWVADLGSDNLQRYQDVLKRMAKPCRLYGDELVETPYPPRGISAAAGLISTVFDLAKFDAAIDRHRFLKQETQDHAWTPFVSNSGRKLPHGLGWFSEEYMGQRLIWHYGNWPDQFSATYVKVPGKQMTFLLLASSGNASVPFYYTGGIETSPFACSFLQLFVFDGSAGCEAETQRTVSLFRAARRAHVRTAVHVDSATLARYAGQYPVSPNRTFTVRAIGDGLEVDIPRGSWSKLYPESSTTFFLKTTDAEITFVEANGTIRMDLDLPDRTIATRSSAAEKR